MDFFHPDQFPGGTKKKKKMSNQEEKKEDSSQKKPVHLLIFPFPSSGHIIPLLDLTRRLLTRYNHHLTVTFLITPPSLSLLQPLLNAFPPSQLQPLILSPPESHSQGLISKIRALHALSGPIISWFRAHPSPPNALLCDFFLAWTHSLLCSTLCLPRFVFYPSGAFGCSMLYSMWRTAPANPEADPDLEVRFDDVPGSPRFKWSELSLLFRGGKPGDHDWDLFQGELLSNLTSHGALFNSFSELESVYINHFRKIMGHDRVWAVGPLLPAEEDPEDTAQRGGPSSVPAQEVLTWLDGKPEGSVVYVCFGSRSSPTVEESAVLGAGLESSGVHFIWCIRESESADRGMMPDSDYEDRVAGRGFIIRGWAPQLAILRHRAVVAFLTHCGWNSVLESISAGVMMLAWPMGADQYANAQLVDNQLGLGLQVGGNGPPNSSNLTRVLVDSVNTIGLQKGRVMKLMEAAATAVKSTGTSAADLDKFFKCLSELN